MAHPHLPQVNDPLVGTVVDGRYEIQQRVGEGGMGVVYRARQISIDRIVAIKMLSQQMAKDPNWVKRFNQEAKACSRLQHPNTIRMFDFGQTPEGRLYMAMEFLDGQSLRQAIGAGPMAAVRVLKILIQCCASLSEAHSFGIVHRDIKPDNVFLLNLAGSPDFVKLLDFSVAKLLQENDAMRTQAGVVFGTPQYMSPEQGRGLPLDPRSDIYALGILAYEMLTGRVPFTDENPMNVLQMHIRAAPPPLPANVPQGMRDVVMRALEKDPGRRYQSAQEMMQHCQQIFTSMGAQLTGMGGAPAPGRPAPSQQKTMMAQGGLAELGITPPPPASAQKTMMAEAAQLSGGSFGPPPAAMKTMIADGGLGAFGPPPATPDAHAPAPPPSGPSDGAPKKTMMLESSEGVVSFAARGESAAVPSPQTAAPTGPAAPSMDKTDSTSMTDVGGASALFWIICLVTGLGIGVLAYLAVLKLG